MYCQYIDSSKESYINIVQQSRKSYWPLLNFSLCYTEKKTYINKTVCLCVADVGIFEYFQPFSGNFKRKQYSSERPPSEHFKNNLSCKPLADFARRTLIDRLQMGAISLVGKVGEVNPPHLVLPLTVEPSKPRLCHDARFLNLWMKDMPFQLSNSNSSQPPTVCRP